MTTRLSPFRRPWGWLLVGLLALGSCGKDEADPSMRGAAPGPGRIETKAIADDLALLVPADTVVLLYVPTLEGLLRKVQAVVRPWDADAAAQVDYDALRNQAASQQPAVKSVLDELDGGKPLAVALILKAGEDGGEPEPQPVFILPMKNADKASGALQVFLDSMSPVGGQNRPVVSGSYVAFGIAPGTARLGEKAPPIASEMATGDLSVRVDTARLVSQFRQEIDGGLRQMAGAGADLGQGMPGMEPLAGLLEGMVAEIRKVVDSAERFDLGLHIEGTRVQFSGRYTAREGSPLSGATSRGKELAALAGALPKDWPFYAAVQFDFARLWSLIEGLTDASQASMPEEQREAFAAYMENASEMMRHFGEIHGFAYRVGPGGMEMVGVNEVKDPDAYMAAYEKFAAQSEIMSAMGVELDLGPPREVAGAEARTITMRIDQAKMLEAQGMSMPPEMAEQGAAVFTKMMESFFGAGGQMVFHVAMVDKKAVTVMGQDEGLLDQTIRATRSGAKPGGALARSASLAGGEPSFLVHAEVRTLLRGFLGLLGEAMPPEMAEKIPVVGEGPAVPLDLWASAEGRHYGAGVSIEAGALAGLVMPLVQSAMSARGTSPGGMDWDDDDEDDDEGFDDR